jgi:hypothetical protein
LENCIFPTKTGKHTRLEFLLRRFREIVTKVNTMSFSECYKQEINPEVALLLMPELKKDYIKDNPCKWRKGRITLWEVASTRIEDCNPSIETYSILCTLVFFIKKENIDISLHPKKQCKNK